MKITAYILNGLLVAAAVLWLLQGLCGVVAAAVLVVTALFNAFYLRGGEVEGAGQIFGFFCNGLVLCNGLWALFLAFTALSAGEAPTAAVALVVGLVQLAAGPLTAVAVSQDNP